MDTALHNIQNAMSANAPQNDQDKRRKFQRFENKHMYVKFQICKGGKAIGETFNATIFDVSAGGMRINIDSSQPFKSGDTIAFEISKDSNSGFLKGMGELVRSDSAENKTSIGVRFLEVAH